MAYIATALDVRSVEESLKFYTEVLGCTEWFRFGEETLVAAGLHYGEGRILISRTDKEVQPNSFASLYFVVDGDIDALWNRAKDRAKVIDPIADRYWGDRTFVVADPDGYTVQLAKEKAQN